MKKIADTDLEDTIRSLVGQGFDYITALVHVCDVRGIDTIDIAHWVRKHPAFMTQLEAEGIEDGTLKASTTLGSVLK